jgi:hypothetical protein
MMKLPTMQPSAEQTPICLMYQTSIALQAMAAHLSNNSTNPTIPLFIVQKSWFDGPRCESSKDLPLLFVNRNMAEQVAGQSAHAYARQEPVRTVLSGGADYAFAARGILSWVRCVEANVADAPLAIAMNTILKQPFSITTSSITLNSPQAYCAVTCHVIGGTGNPNSRRGSERRENCVAIAHTEAFAVGHLQRPSLETQIQVLPVINDDSIVNSDSLYRILQAWPDAHHWVLSPQHGQDLDKKRECFKNDLSDLSRTKPSLPEGMTHPLTKKRAI